MIHPSRWLGQAERSWRCVAFVQVYLYVNPAPPTEFHVISVSPSELLESATSTRRSEAGAWIRTDSGMQELYVGIDVSMHAHGASGSWGPLVLLMLTRSVGPVDCLNRRRPTCGDPTQASYHAGLSVSWRLAAKTAMKEIGDDFKHADFGLICFGRCMDMYLPCR
jgi:hypothetical protein